MAGRDFFQWLMTRDRTRTEEADGSQKTAFSILKMKTWTTALASVGRLAELLPGSCASERARTRGQLSSKVSVPHWRVPSTTVEEMPSGSDLPQRRIKPTPGVMILCPAAHGPGRLHWIVGAPWLWPLPLRARSTR